MQFLRNLFDIEYRKAFDLLSMCKENIFYTIENFHAEIKDIKKFLEELRSHRTNIKQPMKSLSEILPDGHNYTPKQIALLEELEQEILDSEGRKGELELCEQLYLTMLDRKKEKIRILSQILGKINAVEYDLNSEAAKLIFGWRNLCSAFCDALTAQNQVFENDLAKFEDADQLMEAQEISIENIEEMLKHATSLKESILGSVVIKLQDLKAKELKLNEEVSQTRLKCRYLLEEFVEVLEDDLESCIKSFENLKNHLNVPEEDIDETELSDAQKIVECCKKCVMGLIENGKKRIHAVNLELKFLIGNYEESNIEKYTALPSWQERFLLFLGMDKEESAVIKKAPLVQDSFVQISKKEVKGSSETSGGDTKSSGKAKLMKYEDLMQSLIHKRVKMVFQVEQTWDELLLVVTETVSKQNKVSALLLTEKETFIQLSSWMNILTKAIDTWNKNINEGLAAKTHENTLLQWKSKMKEKEYSKFVAGYLYGTEDEIQMETTDTKNLTLDLKKLTLALDKTDTEDESFDDKQKKTAESSSWEEIFADAINVIKEGNKLVHTLKKQDSKIQYQAARLHMSWNDCFFKAVEIWKEDLEKKREENDVLQDVAQKVRNKMYGGIQDAALKFETKLSEVWTHKIFELFHVHEQELAEAINIKKLEMKQGLPANLLVDFVNKEDDIHIYDIPTVDIIKQGKRMFNIALNLKTTETKVMETELNLLTRSEMLDAHVQKIPKPIEIMQKIISAAIDFKKSSLQLPQQKKKVSHIFQYYQNLSLN
ncbi:uncharacterized protein NPIL_429062 [Nephila pilipes]|uniref:Uncharacterized protein n=1 Tax=Nephila pilipes TaxID=299642 RepID=A0A8X6QGY1_NEPPI|nr:uncharacterized protein NPIL_429062 [Nephila pilipes]